MFGNKKKEPKTDYGVKMYGSVTIGTKGQIVIPKDIRDELDLSEGDTLMSMTKHGKLVAFIKADDMQAFINMLQEECRS